MVIYSNNIVPNLPRIIVARRIYPIYRLLDAEYTPYNYVYIQEVILVT